MDTEDNLKINKIKDMILNYFSETIGTTSSTYQLISKRMDNIIIEVLDNEAFKSYYEERMGKTTLTPSGFYDHSKGKVILKNSNFDIVRILETTIHEIIHALSDNGNNKLGLLQYDDRIGRSFNEMATCYITSKILGKGKGGAYSLDYHEVFKLFLKTMEMDESELFSVFFGEKNWITKDMCYRFDKNNPEALKQLLSIYDRRTTKGFDANLVLQMMSQSAKSNNILDTDSYKDFLNNYCDFFDINVTMTESAKTTTTEQPHEAKLETNLGNSLEHAYLSRHIRTGQLQEAKANIRDDTRRPPQIEKGEQK